MTNELMKLQTYGRLFQRLASTCGQIPLGIYRSVPIVSCPEIVHSELPQRNPEAASRFLQSRMKLLGLDSQGMYSSATSLRVMTYLLLFLPTQLFPKQQALSSLSRLYSLILPRQPNSSYRTSCERCKPIAFLFTVFLSYSSHDQADLVHHLSPLLYMQPCTAALPNSPRRCCLHHVSLCSFYACSSHDYLSTPDP